jgi:hypothetical protein
MTEKSPFLNDTKTYKNCILDLNDLREFFTYIQVYNFVSLNYFSKKHFLVRLRRLKHCNCLNKI